MVEPILQQEPKALQLIELLRRLPRFDPTKKASDLQGDIPEVKLVEQQFHSWNTTYQTRVNGEVVRSPLLLALFELPEWKNFQRLVSHSTAGRERRKKANKRYRDRRSPEQAFSACREKRRTRIVEWLEEHGPRLIEALREAHPVGGNTRFDPQVLNELEARFVDEARAELEYWRLLWVVILEQHSQHPSPETLNRVRKVARRIFGPQEAEHEISKVTSRALQVTA